MTRLSLVDRRPLRDVVDHGGDELSGALAEIDRLRLALADSVPLRTHRGVKNELQRKRQQLQTVHKLLAAAIEANRGPKS